jgi:hypothetical protein
MHYYGALPCEVCEDVEVKPREDEIAECGGCNKLMCDDCVMSFTECDVCLAKFNALHPCAQIAWKVVVYARSPFTRRARLST